MGLVVGWIVSGIFMSWSGGYEDFDSERLAECKMAYAIFSTIAFIMLLVHLIVSAYRESQRKISYRM